ncbi:uncharacterized protein JN550_013681 [Neoarthrinium moseri]|uniref:uncharacterized protein n=1 Tax=Neoarthrinium moseri TaxID=1658444 RepID=UPI001FDB01CC|nr:uncharacterized protein JN550_013681 [Neoarthrinium moseri]KAI1856714.1 hypothetical protein JN550_013681 [Neoarthrinium moseri]
MVPPFQYRDLSLDRKEIRLIEVEPLEVDGFESRSGPESVVRCHLKHASLNDPPWYRALSYVWGDPTHTSQILLDGQRFHVTANLESALRHVAAVRQQEAGPVLTLWVDAICINQQNEDEKMHQVSQMKTIFETASETLLWLGPASEDSDLAIDTLRSMNSMAISMKGLFSSWSAVPFAEKPSDPLVAAVQSVLDQVLIELCRDDSARLRAISALFDRPWFRRVWVIQERVLSFNSTVCCGRESIMWGIFYDGFWILCGLRDYINLVGCVAGRGDSSALATYLTTALDKVVPVAFTPRRSSVFLLFSLLSRMATQNQLQASDRRDYVFALLGLIDPGKSPSIMADYTKDWPSIQVKVAKACLAYYGPSFLSFAGVCESTESSAVAGRAIPSWAPDWSSEHLPQPLSVASVFVVRGNNRRSAYSVSAGYTQTLSRGFSDGHRLALAAFLVDEVVELGRPFAQAETFTQDTARVESLALWLRDFDEILPSTNEVYQTLEQVKEALWRTPIADRGLPHNWERERASDQTFATYQALRAGQVIQGVKYANIANSQLYRRRPFRSCRGHLGLGPLGTSTGDSIWVIPGADVPFILRPAGNNTFLVIGEAYVHGIMDNEPWISPPVGQLQKIELI